MASGVTIYDIAREAGISSSTVSRVINGSALVSGETSRSVLEVANRLGYSPRRIKRHASRAILHIVVFLPQAERPQSHLFYDAAALFSGIQDGFGSLRAHLIVSLNNSTDPLTAKKLGDIDGCIFAFASPTPELRLLLGERGVPTVLINRVDEQFSYVANDADAGITAMLEAIRDTRPRDRVCFVAVEDARPVADYRARAVESSGAVTAGAVTPGAAPPGAVPPGAVPPGAVTPGVVTPGVVTPGASGFNAESPVVRWVPTVSEITLEWVAGLVEEGFRVLMCVNDFVAAAVYDRLTQLGIAVPGEVGITGYDGAAVIGLLSRAITTIDLSVGELGREAGDLLGGMIVERNFARIERMIVGEMLRGETL